MTTEENTIECGCGFEFDGTLKGAENHDCPADHHAKGCGCADAYEICDE